ncbi:hypothetical protein PENTCL1PPCAC_8966, partial [Pristionchus entomophagus]
SELVSHRERSGWRSGARRRNGGDDDGPAIHLPCSSEGVRYRAMDEGRGTASGDPRRLLDHGAPQRPTTVARAAQ